MIKQAVLLKEVQRQTRQPALLGFVYRLRRTLGVLRARGAHLDKDYAGAVQGDQIQLAIGATIVSLQNAIAEPAQKTGGRSLGSSAEPAPPPRFPGWRLGHFPT